MHQLEYDYVDGTLNDNIATSEEDDKKLLI